MKTLALVVALGTIAAAQAPAFDAVSVKINTSGVIPPIFASSLIMFPATLASIVNKPWMNEVANLLSYQGLIFNILFVALIIFFCYFYNSVSFNPKDIAENLKKWG